MAAFFEKQSAVFLRRLLSSFNSTECVTVEIGDAAIKFINLGEPVSYIEKLIKKKESVGAPGTSLTDLVFDLSVNRSQASLIAFIHNNTPFKLQGVKSTIYCRKSDETFQAQDFHILLRPGIVWLLNGSPVLVRVCPTGVIDLTFSNLQTLDFNAINGFKGKDPYQLVSGMYYKTDGVSVQVVTLDSKHYGFYKTSGSWQIISLDYDYGGIIEYVEALDVFVVRRKPLSCKNSRFVAQLPYEVGGPKHPYTDGVIISTGLKDYRVKYSKTVDLEVRRGMIMSRGVKVSTDASLEGGIYEFTFPQYEMIRKRPDKRKPNTAKQLDSIKSAMTFELFLKFMNQQSAPDPRLFSNISAGHLRSVEKYKTAPSQFVKTNNTDFFKARLRAADTNYFNSLLVMSYEDGHLDIDKFLRGLNQSGYGWDPYYLRLTLEVNGVVRVGTKFKYYLGNRRGLHHRAWAPDWGEAYVVSKVWKGTWGKMNFARNCIGDFRYDDETIYSVNSRYGCAYAYLDGLYEFLKVIKAKQEMK